MTMEKKEKEIKETERQKEQQDPQGADRERNLDFEMHKKKQPKI